MARNGNGVYAVVTPIRVGAVRSSSAVNGDFTDLGAEITNTIPLDGTAGMSGQFKAAKGSMAEPSISFGNSKGTGFYRSAEDEMSAATIGAQRFKVDANGKIWLLGDVDIAGALGDIATYTGSNDTAAIEALSGTGLLRRTGTNLWSLDDGTHSIPCLFDTPNVVLQNNVCADIWVPYACTITGVTMESNAAGTCTLDIRKCTYAQFDAGGTHPVSGDSICSSSKPSLSATYKYTDSTLTGWTTAISAGDVLRFILTSTATIKRLRIDLTVKRFI